MTDAIEIPTRTLVYAMVQEDGRIDAGDLYAVAEALGMSDQQVRLCLRRLAGDGQLVQDGRGRRASLRVTDAQRTLAPNVEFVRFAYRQDRGEAPWDGHWRLIAFAVPETRRAARDGLRDAIVRLGGAPLQGGLYAFANPIEPLVETAARELGVLDTVSFAVSPSLRIGEEQDPRRLAARLWPLDALAAGHDQLLRVVRPRLERLERADELPTRDALVLAMELAAAFTRALEPDPLLPSELLPQPWPGIAARAAFARAWEILTERLSDTDAPRLFAAYAEGLGEPADGG